MLRLTVYRALDDFGVDYVGTLWFLQSAMLKLSNLDRTDQSYCIRAIEVGLRGDMQAWSQGQGGLKSTAAKGLANAATIDTDPYSMPHG